ncbi:2331_t:CDS:1, partial [Gigaspora rosea]
LPNELAQVMELSSQIPELQHLNLPIKRYEDISPTEDLLYKYFIFNTLPLHFTDVPDLPEPTWDILNNYAPRTQDTQPMSDPTIESRDT